MNPNVQFLQEELIKEEIKLEQQKKEIETFDVLQSWIDLEKDNSFYPILPNLSAEFIEKYALLVELEEDSKESSILELARAIFKLGKLLSSKNYLETVKRIKRLKKALRILQVFDRRSSYRKLVNVVYKTVSDSGCEEENEKMIKSNHFSLFKHITYHEQQSNHRIRIHHKNQVRAFLS